jgi:protein TonB
MKYLVFICSLVISLKTVAQSDSSRYIYNNVEQMPKPGFDLPAYIAKNLHCHSDTSEVVKGQIILKFVVNEDGSISNIEVGKSINLTCDEEAIIMIKHMPQWVPGIKNGKKVKVWYYLPIHIDWQ